MRESWTCLAWATIGFVGIGASPAQARQFGAVVIPMNTVAAGSLPANLSGRALPLAKTAQKRSPDSYATPTLSRYIGADGMLDPIRRGLQSRGSGMFDVYARGTSGVRLSGGAHYQMRYDPESDGALSGSAAMMRLPGGAVALRDGYERYAPVAMAGYDAAVSDRLKVGVEGGMMVGRATAMFGTSSLANEMNVSRTASNPVADVVMTYRF